MDTVRFHPVPSFGPDGNADLLREQVPPSEPGATPRWTWSRSVSRHGQEALSAIRAGRGRGASPDGAWVAYVSRTTCTWRPCPAREGPVEIDGESPRPVYASARKGRYIGWADSGSTVVWGMGSTIYRQASGPAARAI